MCLFLLVGGQELHADTSSVAIKDFSSFTLIKKEQIKHKKVEPGSLLIEEVGVDLDEEFHRSDDVNGGINKLIPVRHSLLDNWYLTFSDKFLFKNSTKEFEFFTPNCGYFSPIYLRIGVLRI
ncbi:hypothetical protein EM308_14605 [Flavobacterium gilvum]|uniref:Uncharacterized protein n=1 Tax=Flavobacterium gilvum TaxID=1492737 RepID=A0AAC9I7R7_9FLAO|nr:hypothetical protein EM308_14605 [Flavobacterium gilvum]